MISSQKLTTTFPIRITSKMISSFIWIMMVTVPTVLAKSSNTLQAVPTVTAAQTCKLDLSDELFGGVKLACEGNDLDRSRCCPVLAAWLLAAHARSALTVDRTTATDLTPGIPLRPDDDSRLCVKTLQDALQNRNIHIVMKNESCDPVLCFCGIRLHKITSLTCPSAFIVNSTSHTATPTAMVKSLEQKCLNSSNSGCTNCLGALQKLKPGNRSDTTERGKRLLSRDCQLMGLTWLLARNKTAYIPTVSAVLRAIVYSRHLSEHNPRCSPEQDNMPLAVDSLELEKTQSVSPAMMLKPSLTSAVWLILLWLLFYP